MSNAEREATLEDAMTAIKVLGIRIDQQGTKIAELYSRCEDLLQCIELGASTQAEHFALIHKLKATVEQNSDQADLFTSH